MFIISALTPKRKHYLRCIGEAVLLGLFFLLFGFLLFFQERDKIYATHDRLLAVYTVYTESMFADINDMIDRAGGSFFDPINTFGTSIIEGIWHGRQKDDPLLENATLLDSHRNILFSVQEKGYDRETIDSFLTAPTSINGIRISEPFQRADGEWALCFSRAFFGKDGEVSGYAITEFNLRTIADRYQQLTSINASEIALFSKKGAVIARAFKDRGDFGWRLPEEFMPHRSNPEKRFAVIGSGDETRIVSFAPIEAYNMFMSCSTSYYNLYERLTPIFIGFFVIWLILAYTNWKISRILLNEENVAINKERSGKLALEHRVENAEKTKLEHERILIQQAKMAAMGEMIGAIAHQWRQPLNSIGLYIQDLLDAYRFGALNEEYLTSSVEKTMWQLKFMSATIDDFSNFFRPDKKKEVFDLSKAVRNAISLVFTQLRKSEINVVFEIPCEPLWCDGYENEFGQTVLNLITNARDAVTAAKKRERKITIRLTRNEDEAQLEVEDNGGGIPNDIIDRIFEPYFTTKAPKKGSGIGLYMCKMIIEDSMKGKIGVSNVKYGARFFIDLPIVREGL
ncbi:MAG: ATP-binding protein [Helicobacteraceae bacterium]|jgi:signal transduction histidine kinase|nr:ATP-binding protein [Helicobacteraceae bacterium]